MGENMLQIDEPVAVLFRRAKELDNLSGKDDSEELVRNYRELVARQNQMLLDLCIYKEREMDAFTIGDAISDGIYLVDASGVVMSVNKSYTKITGIAASEVVGKNILEICDKEPVGALLSQKVLEQGKKKSSLSTMAKTNKNVLVTGTPFIGEDGQVDRVLTVLRDLSEITKLKEELEKTARESENYLNQLNYFRTQSLENKALIGENVNIQKMRELIGHIAKTDATVLISGETGSGKELVANEIHDQSDRKYAPFVKVNCAAIPEALMESELFGYERGAFTGAQQKGKLGLFEMAHSGTILLDEISEMPLNLQSKLLRTLQEKEIIRVGGTKSISLNVRVIASSNQNLQELVNQGKFREDLYYRLNVVPIRIPPLRERKDDIALLAYAFLESFNIKYGKSKNFDSSALQSLEYYEWPGNVRELKNVIERLVVINDESHINYASLTGVLGKNKLAANFVDSTLTLRQAVEMLEKEMLEAALAKYNSTYKAARVLGLTQPTVYRKAKAYGIKPYDG